MSRVHDALRRAAQGGVQTPIVDGPSTARIAASAAINTVGPNLDGLLDRVQEVVWTPPADSLLIDPTRPMEAPTEEFRTLRTRLNHMQSLQPIHTMVVTSASP